jgi:hypothetical protein
LKSAISTTYWNISGNLDSGLYTSHQIAGHSVIDYAIVSAGLLPLVQEFHVESLTDEEDDDWADHSRISITLDSKIF